MQDRQFQRFIEYTNSQFERKGIRRKYTGEPYINHCLELVSILDEFGIDDFRSKMIAVGHDLLEDIDDIWPSDIVQLFREIEIDDVDSFKIVDGIIGLTDNFTAKSYPKLNRKIRKQREAERLSELPSKLQSIKYADLISNTKSIIEHDEKFAKIYLNEKEQLLKLMVNGDQRLFHAAKSLLNEQLFKISRIS